MIKYILVNCKYSNLKGLYKQNGNSNSYTKLNDKISIYKLYNRHWVLGIELNSPSYYTIIPNSPINDPLEINEWKNGSTFITISEYNYPSIENIQKDIIINSKYNNIDGLYNYKGIDQFGNPYYINNEDNMTFWFGLFEKKWYISPKIHHYKIYYSFDSNKVNPLDIDKTKYGKAVYEIKEFVKPNEKNQPKLIGIKSKYTNIDGSYELKSVDKNNYPIYYNNEDNMYIWYKIESGCWYIGHKENGDYYFRIKSPENEITKIDKKNYKDLIYEIYEIDWIDEKDDNFYSDLDFPTNMKSIGKELDHKVEWIRATELDRKKKEILYDTISPKDLCQGRVGNCWLIAALSVIAQYPKLIENMLGGLKELAPDHRYEIQLWDIKSRCFTSIVVDDYIPCYEREQHKIEAKPIFCNSSNNTELWPLLVEKAFAKKSGSYYNLDGGFVSWAWFLITGVEKQIIFKKKRNGWKKYQSRINYENLSFYSNYRSGYKSNSYMHHIFNILLKGEYLLAASIDGKIEEELNNGLITGHAYSITGIYNINGEKLIKLRNPWGNEKEWLGDWSDSWEGWNNNQEILEKTNHSLEKDGLFLMNFNDFFNLFSSINICKI